MVALPTPRGVSEAERLMRRALDVARTTPPADIPVGAVVFGPDGSELAAATNRRETDLDPTAHAEVLAIREAVKHHGDGWRLSGCTLVVTLEPCAMCAGALVGARLDHLIFGAAEPRTGACGSVLDIVRDRAVMHQMTVRGGVLAEECAQLLSNFFETHRVQNRPRDHFGGTL
ncbi:nucleoside deaminase [Corynebacterium poyangense]|uniref:nucleoside deaminase n=1 Tax=Corynebacterium poyangense TaxID=2684405 RepID=UPI0029625692|nr:nucleoside deaminase [Corynebacterium poyangense]